MHYEVHGTTALLESLRVPCSVHDFGFFYAQYNLCNGYDGWAGPLRCNIARGIIRAENPIVSNARLLAYASISARAAVRPLTQCQRRTQAVMMSISNKSTITRPMIAIAPGQPRQMRTWQTAVHIYPTSQRPLLATCQLAAFHIIDDALAPSRLAVTCNDNTYYIEPARTDND